MADMEHRKKNNEMWATSSKNKKSPDILRAKKTHHTISRAMTRGATGRERSTD